MKIVLFQRERPYQIDKAIVILGDEQDPADFMPLGFSVHDVFQSVLVWRREEEDRMLPTGIVFYAEPEKK